MVRLAYSYHDLLLLVIIIKFSSGEKVEGILQTMLDWLCVMIKNRDSLKKAYDQVHPLLKRYLKAEWLNIVDLALKGQTDEAMAALISAKEAIKKVFDSNKTLMDKIRKLDEGPRMDKTRKLDKGPGYYFVILKATAVGALSGAAAGGGGGAMAGGPLGATLGAVVGVSVGAVGGFYAAGYHAVKTQEKDK
jgi:DNA-directed RNA polymerase subunit L